MNVMVAGLPSSGATWVGDCVKKGAISLTTDEDVKEYHNPICNPKRYLLLQQRYGCELPECQYNLAAPCYPDDQELSAIHAAGWVADGHSFCKEAWVLFQLPFLATKFKVIVVQRSAQYTFPPARLRVLNWYAAYWESLKFNMFRYPRPWSFHLASWQEAANMSVLVRAVVAHACLTAWQEKLIRDLCLPVMEWDEMIIDMITGNQTGYDARMEQFNDLGLPGNEIVKEMANSHTESRLTLEQRGDRWRTSDMAELHGTCLDQSRKALRQNDGEKSDDETGAV